MAKELIVLAGVADRLRPVISSTAASAMGLMKPGLTASTLLPRDKGRLAVTDSC